MNQIEQTLTSMEVAEMIEKKHNELLKDIRRYVKNLNEGDFPHVDFFCESAYIDGKGEERPCYLISKKGCDFIANKLTGVKGAVFTAKYINRFHEMEQKITAAKPLSALEQIKLQNAAIVEVDEKVTNLANDFNNFKNDMPILAIDCERITNAKSSKGINLMGGKNSNAYNDNSLRSRVYRDMDNQLRREFGIRTYKAIKRNQCDKAIEIINNYELPLVLAEEIKVCNAQLKFEAV